jgi:hypothetical protein
MINAYTEASKSSVTTSKPIGLPPRNTPERKTFSNAAPVRTEGLPARRVVNALPGALPVPVSKQVAPQASQEPVAEKVAISEAPVYKAPVTAQPSQALPVRKVTSGALPGSVPLVRKAVQSLPAPKASVATETAPVAVKVTVPVQAKPTVTKQTVAPTTTPAKKKNKKKLKRLVLTDRDFEIFELAYKFPILTDTHFGMYFRDPRQTLAQSTHSVKQRLNQLRGDKELNIPEYLLRDDASYPYVWRPSTLALNHIGVGGEAPRNFPAMGFREHLLKIATVGILWMREHDAENPAHDVRHGLLSDHGKVFITEKQISTATKPTLRSDEVMKRNWVNDTAEFIDFPDYPRGIEPNMSSRIADIETAYSVHYPPEEVQEVLDTFKAMEDDQNKQMREAWNAGQGAHHIPMHMGKQWGKTHTPDGWISLPRILNPDGETVRGGDFAIEVEVSAKPRWKDYVRILQQLWDHPLADGCIYYVAMPKTGLKPATAYNRIEQAMKEIENSNFKPNAPGKKRLRDYFVFMDQPHLNLHLHTKGIYG